MLIYYIKLLNCHTKKLSIEQVNTSILHLVNGIKIKPKFKRILGMNLRSGRVFFVIKPRAININ